MEFYDNLKEMFLQACRVEEAAYSLREQTSALMEQAYHMSPNLEEKDLPAIPPEGGVGPDTSALAPRWPEPGSGEPAEAIPLPSSTLYDGDAPTFGNVVVSYE